MLLNVQDVALQVVGNVVAYICSALQFKLRLFNYSSAAQLKSFHF